MTLPDDIVHVDTSTLRGDVEFFAILDKACRRRGVQQEDFVNVLLDLITAKAHDDVLQQWQAMSRQFVGERSMRFKEKDWNVVPEGGTLEDKRDRRD